MADSGFARLESASSAAAKAAADTQAQAMLHRTLIYYIECGSRRNIYLRLYRFGYT